VKRKKEKIKDLINQAWPKAPKHEVEEDLKQVWHRLEAELDKRDTSLRSLYGDGWSADPVDQREFQVLSAVSMLGDQADLDKVTDIVQQWTGRSLVVGQVCATLGRLEKRKLIKVNPSGGAENRFEVSEQGDRALRRAKAEGKELMHAQDDLAQNEAQ
jgi:hypothetical protein